MNMKKIYRKIAKENGVTVAEVMRDMQEAIDYAYKNISDDGVTGVYQNQVPRKGKIPTTSEIIRFATQKIKDETK